MTKFSRLLAALLSIAATAGCPPDADPPITIRLDAELPDSSRAPDVGVDAPETVDVRPDGDGASSSARPDGDACEADAQCVGGTCLTGEGFPGGLCALDGCDGGCAPGSECSYSSEFGIFCAAVCVEQDDCRDGYACRTQGVPDNLHRLCTPIRGVPDGEACVERHDCQGGTCLPWRGGYCSTNRCDSNRDCASLGGVDNRCVDDGAGGICLRACTNTDECRPGYLCTTIGFGARFCLEDPVRPFDDTVFDPSPLGIQCGIPVNNGEATIDYQIAAGTTSYMLTPMARDGRPLNPRRVTLPDGTAQTFNLEREFMTLNTFALSSMIPTLVPPGPDFADMLAEGANSYTLGAEGSELCYYLLEKQGLGSVLDVNVYLVGVAGVTAATAASDPNFAAVFDEVSRIYGQVGVSIGAKRYFDVSPADATRFGVLRNEGEIDEIVKLSRAPGADLDSLLSVNVFFVGQILVPGAVLGLSAGLPGPVGLHGTHGSGVVFTAEHMGGPTEDTFGQPTDGNLYTALVLAHELGHWLGLMHTSERTGLDPDQLSDTPECADVNLSEQCPDWGNLMFPFAGGGNSALTDDQGFVLRANPATR